MVFFKTVINVQLMQGNAKFACFDRIPWSFQIKGVFDQANSVFVGSS